MDKVTISFTVSADEAAELLVAYRAITHAGREELTNAVREFASNRPPQMPPVAADAPAASAPAAAPSTSPAPATVSADLDSRGVPYHADHHAARTGATGGKNPDGTWKRRRGHDKAAADAYEAQYVGKSPTAAGSANDAPTSTGNVGASANPNGSASNVGFPAPPVAAVAGASTITAPPPGCPGMEEFKNRWIDLVQRNRVGREHEDYILTQWGAHPVAGEAAYAADPVKRTAVYQFMQTYL